MAPLAISAITLATSTQFPKAQHNMVLHIRVYPLINYEACLTTTNGKRKLYNINMLLSPKP